MRRSGLDLVGNVPWGTHFCQFYQTPQDLIDVLVAYFRQGLLDNEYCMWITSEPLGVDEARAALKKAVPDLDERIAKGQIEILDYRGWYVIDGKFDCDRVLAGWAQRERAALERGFAGLRLTGNTFWLEKSDWRSFTDYEEAVDRVIGSHRMMALCTYSIDRCGAFELMDVLRNHQFALIKQQGKWELIQSRRAEEKIRHQNAVLQGINRVFREGMKCETEEKLGRMCLNVIEEVTQSRFGFIGEVDEKGMLDVIAISDPGWAACRMEPATGRRVLGSFKIHGIYGRVLLDGRPIFTNNPGGHPDSIGTPVGHPPIQAFLGVPLMHAGKPMGMVAVANREGGYRQQDLDAMESLAAAVVQVFMRHRGERALDHQREWLRVTLTSIGDAVIATDTEAKVTFINPVAAEMTGWPAEEARGQDVLQVLRTCNESTGEPAEDVVAQVLREKRTVAMANHSALITRDGRKVPIEDSAAPIVDADGNLTGVVLVFHDVTEKRQAQNALLRAKQEWERTFDSVPDLIAILDDRHRMVRVNRAMAQRLATTPEQCIGSNCYQCVHGASGPPAFCPHTQTIRDGLAHAAEVHEERLGGDFLVTTTPLCDEGGRRVGTVHVARDITERKRAERELERAKQIAEAASRAKDQFIAALSHELRTPLTPSLAAAGAMLHDPRLPEDVRADAAMIQRNIGLEVALINDLLDVTRIANGKLTLSKGPVDLSNILREAGRICCPELDAKSQTLTIDTPGSPYLMDADAARVHQVFWNLVKNAIKFTPERGRIEIKGAAADGTIRVSVSDNGIGIDPKVLPRLFGAFEQGDPANAFGGLGLGLAIAKGVVEAHGGRISARSDGLGKGATFTVELPLLSREQIALLPATAGSSHLLHDRPLPLGQPLRILLVEDHADTARTMARLLMAEGHEVVIAGSMRNALAAADGRAFDVLMSDLGLPDGSGHELMRRLLSSGKRLRGIAISGYGTASDVQESRNAGFLEHITKPVAFDALHQALIRVANEMTAASVARRNMRP